MPKNTLRTSVHAAIAGTVLALAACVPVPYATRAYVPNEADVILTQGSGSGCGLGTDKSIGGHRDIGQVRMHAHLSSENAESANSTAKLQFSFVQQSSRNQTLNVSVNPSRVRLHEGGQTLSGKLEDMRHVDFSDGMRGDYISLTFGAPSGIRENVKIEFQPGAVRIGGRSIAVAPIRYELSVGTSVYMFPCIPT